MSFILTDLSLKAVYDSSEHDLVDDLFCPLLANAVEYRRGVGYFTSGWLREAAKGLLAFAQRGGRAYFVTSPHLESKDWDAFKLADRAQRDVAVYSAIRRNVVDLAETLNEDTATALAWLVADGVLTFTFAVPKNNVGDFHDKFGVCQDEAGNRVAFHGSYNDSVHGGYNGESFSVFRSWVPGQDIYVDEHAERFERIWSGENDFFDTYSMTEAIAEDIKQLRKDHSRPYNLPGSKPLSTMIAKPSEIDLYPFQREGIRNWNAAGGRGMFEMATGTGKTFTALTAAAELHKRLGSLAVVVAAPFNHLVDQWRDEAARFGFVPILCRDTSADWTPLVRSRVQDFNFGARRSLFLITTHKTCSENTFTGIAQNLRGNTLFIADEVHYLGSPQNQRALLDTYAYRIGLSATPERWFDPVGTGILRDYFGNSAMEMPLEQAIGRFLTPYVYMPHLVQLTAAEMREFSRLSSIIWKLMQLKPSERNKRKSTLERNLRMRAGLVAKAANKLPTLQRLIRAKIDREGLRNVRHTLVYCAPGETAVVVHLLAELGLKVHEFIYTVDNEQRVRILKQFEDGELQVLVAIKCLDEGVNIPATKEAYFLASTSNPREFVQRRGRVLRTFPGKDRAVLHDLIVTPPQGGAVDARDTEVERALLRRELPRFAEFCSAAMNEFEARSVLFPLLLDLNMVHLMDLRPWDIYHHMDKGDDHESADS